MKELKKDLVQEDDKFEKLFSNPVLKTAFERDIAREEVL
jgi:hypothetical protein